MADELQWIHFYDHTGGLNTRNTATSTPIFDALAMQNIENVTRGGFRKINGFTRFAEAPIIDETAGTYWSGSIAPTAEADAWTGAGPGTSTAATSGGIYTITEDAAGAIDERYHNAEAGFTTGTDAVFECRMAIADSGTLSGVYQMSICVLDDAADRFELVAIQTAAGVKQIGVLTTTGDRTIIGSYSSLNTHDWTVQTRYRAIYDASGNVDVYVNDMTTALFSIAVSSLPDSTETVRVAFGSFEAATTAVSSWDYLIYEIDTLTFTTFPITGIYSFVDETGVQDEVLVTASTAMYRLVAGEWVALTGGTAFTASAKPHFITFSDSSASDVAITIVTTESKDTPQKYGGGAAQADLGGTPPAGKYCEVYHERVFIGNTTAAPSAVFYSGFGDAEDRDDGTGTWDQTNDVFLVDRHRYGEITGLLNVNQKLLVFVERAVYRLQGWGKGSFILEPITTKNGCVAPNSIIKGPYGDQRREGAFFRDRDGYYWTDGEIGNVFRVSEKILTTVDEDFNATNVANEASFLDRVRGLVAWSNTLGSDSNTSRIHALDYANGPRQQPDGLRIEGWFPYTIDMRAAGTVLESGEDRILFSDHVGLVHKLNDGTNFDNADIDAFRTTAWMDGGAKHLDKLWRHLILFATATGDIELDVEWGVNYQDDLSNIATVNLAAAADLLGTTFILGTSTLGTTGLIHVKIPIDVRANAIRFRFRTDKKAEPFTILGMSIGYEVFDYFESNVTPMVG